jgi:hypothetical protein
VISILAFGLLGGGITLAGVIAVVLAVSAFLSLRRDQELSGSAKTMWIVLVLFFPIFGPVAYYAVRADW